jgi:hypothetical protein
MCDWIACIMVSSLCWGVADTLFDIVISNDSKKSKKLRKSNIHNRKAYKKVDFEKSNQIEL